MEKELIKRHYIKYLGYFLKIFTNIIIVHLLMDSVYLYRKQLVYKLELLQDYR